MLKKLHAERSGLTDVEVRVAAALDDARAERNPRPAAQSASSSEPVLHVAIDPSLIAGIWSFASATACTTARFDTQLEHARRHMIERATEKIETQPERFVRATA